MKDFVKELIDLCNKYEVEMVDNDGFIVDKDGTRVFDELIIVEGCEEYKFHKE